MEKTNRDVVKAVLVKLISTEMVKPSSPTPSNLEILKLSCIDQIMPINPPMLAPGILFYPASTETQPLDIAGLKSSLSRTLTVFYPLAGRVNQSTIICNDEGIPFIVAQVDCPLSTVLYSTPKPDILSKLLPPVESLGVLENQPVSEIINLSIQISVFTCGGVVIAWYDTHKINDVLSSANFFKHWASEASQQEEKPNLTTPNFDIAATTFPPLPNSEPLKYEKIDQAPQEERSVVKLRCFRFRDSAISKLKLKAATHQVLNPTRFQTLAGFIWEQALASKRAPLSQNNNQKTSLFLSMDMRSRLTPPLLQGSVGNLFTAVVAIAEVRAQLPDLVAEINDAFCKKKDEIRGYSSGNVVINPMREDWKKLGGMFEEYKERAYLITSWCKVGFSDLDFGFGKPKWMLPTNGDVNKHPRNSIVLSDYSDSNGDGIEAWLFLEEKEMENLESNTEFLSFASPVF